MTLSLFSLFFIVLCFEIKIFSSSIFKNDLYLFVFVSLKMKVTF